MLDLAYKGDAKKLSIENHQKFQLNILAITGLLIGCYMFL